MKRIICEKIVRILKSKNKLEEKLDVKITNKGKEVIIEGNSEDEYIAERVIDALEAGFSFSTAMLLKDEEDFMLERINIKDHTRRKDLESVRARIIGKNGGTLAALAQLTKCYFEIKDNEVVIIGDAEHIYSAREAVISLTRGAKQANVYNFLEKHQVKPIVDLGLKKQKTRKK